MGRGGEGLLHLLGVKKSFLLSYFELFNFVDQNNGKEKGITILVQKKVSV